MLRFWVFIRAGMPFVGKGPNFGDVYINFPVFGNSYGNLHVFVVYNVLAQILVV